MQEPVPYASFAAAPTYAVDDSNIRVLSILHFVWGGIVLLAGLFSGFYIFMGVMFLKNPGMAGPPTTAPGSPPPDFLGNFFISCGSVGFLFGVILGTLSIFSGVWLAKRHRRGLIKLTAALNCLAVPLGTLLGIFTLVLLSRPSIKATFLPPT